jgi:hypothetical protein
MSTRHFADKCEQINSTTLPPTAIANISVGKHHCYVIGFVFDTVGLNRTDPDVSSGGIIHGCNGFDAIWGFERCFRRLALSVRIFFPTEQTDAESVSVALLSQQRSSML